MPRVDSQCSTHHICECKEARLEMLESHCTQLQAIIADLTCRCGYLFPSRQNVISPTAHEKWCEYRKIMELLDKEEETKNGRKAV